MALPAFRMMWIVSWGANMGMWMNEVTAAWVMTSLTTSPLMIALVQTAATLPVFLFGLPIGALADIFDRRRLYILSQVWAAAAASMLAIAMLTGIITPLLLLILTFANGITLALRWPVFTSIIPNLVPRNQLPAAMALTGIGMNMSRILAPMIAGAIIANVGSAYVFVLNAVLATATAIMIYRWEGEVRRPGLPGERIASAMRVGIQFAVQSPRFHPIMARTTLFFMQAIALIALLPIVARSLPGGGASTYTFLLASMGIGAICAALAVTRIRRTLTSDHLMLIGTIALCVAMTAIALAPRLSVAIPAMMLAGLAWMWGGNTLSVATQLALPDWMRARGMAISQMNVMGSAAVGAALSGQLASMTSVSVALLVMAAAGAILLPFTTRHFRLAGTAEKPAPEVTGTPELEPGIDLQAGPVLVTVEYIIRPEDAVEFKQVMRESRRSHLRRGALSWKLFHDTNAPERYVEHVVDESWLEHLRRRNRVAADDIELRARRLALHQGPEAPRISRRVGQNI